MKTKFSILIFLLVFCIVSIFGQNKSSKQTQKVQPAFTKVVNPDSCVVNIFIENSTSMYGYLGAQDFEYEVGDLITKLQQSSFVKQVRFFYINSQLFEQKCSASKFIKNLTAKNANQGKTGTTSIGTLMDSVSHYTGKDQVSILISDFIISPGKGNSAANVIASEKNYISNVSGILKKKGYAIGFYRMMAGFKGKLYDCNDKPQTINHNRPYFIMTIGETKYITKLAPICTKLKNVNDSIAVTNSYVFYTPKAVKNQFQITSHNSGKFVPNTHATQLCNAQLTQPNPKSNKIFKFSVKVNMSNLSLKGNSFLKNKDNYSLSNQRYKILSVNAEGKGYYLFTIQTESPVSPIELTLSLSDNKPEWRNSVSINECDAIFNSANIEKTYGLEYIVRAVYDVFGSEQSILNGVTIKINK